MNVRTPGAATIYRWVIKGDRKKAVLQTRQSCRNRQQYLRLQDEQRKLLQENWAGAIWITS